MTLTTFFYHPDVSYSSNTDININLLINVLLYLLDQVFEKRTVMTSLTTHETYKSYHNFCVIDVWHRKLLVSVGRETKWTVESQERTIRYRFFLNSKRNLGRDTKVETSTYTLLPSSSHHKRKTESAV